MFAVIYFMVEQMGFEPTTSVLRTRRSAKLSYCPTSEREYRFEFRVSSFESGLSTVFANYPGCNLRFSERSGGWMGDAASSFQKDPEVGWEMLQAGWPYDWPIM